MKMKIIKMFGETIYFMEGVSCSYRFTKSKYGWVTNTLPTTKTWFDVLLRDAKKRAQKIEDTRWGEDGAGGKRQMQIINKLHNYAMDLVEEAFIYKKDKYEKKAKALFQKALETEQKAASQLTTAKESEPTRSILCRSAAALAYLCDNYDAVDRLAHNGLAGFPLRRDDEKRGRAVLRF